MNDEEREALGKKAQRFDQFVQILADLRAGYRTLDSDVFKKVGDDIITVHLQQAGSSGYWIRDCLTANELRVALLDVLSNKILDVERQRKEL